jgi:dihydroorotase
MQRYLIRNAIVVNEGSSRAADVFIENGRIDRIDSHISPKGNYQEINAEGKYLLPGVIDDQVHFREPGLTQKGTIYTEAKAGIAGGVTSYMEMPNTQPPAFTQELLEEKYAIGAKNSLANYSFYMGTSNDNAEEVLKTNARKKDVCGVKIFMGSSTGGLLVDNFITLDTLFRDCEVLIATHCEDEKIIKSNYERLVKEKGHLQPEDHPLVRDTPGCFESSFKAVQLANKYETRLHILHITTAKELQLFSNMLPLKDKRITSEVCVHHLHYTANDYPGKGHLIKCNPAIKAPENRDALWEALLDDRIDVIATDHAPHQLKEKGWERNSIGQLIPCLPGADCYTSYEKAHAGLPLIQHPLLMMLSYVQQGKMTIEKMVEKMSHAVATCFSIKDRGFIREGYFADLVLVDTKSSTAVRKEDLYYTCGWSPLEGTVFPARIEKTFVNGHLVYDNGKWDESNRGMRLSFDR